MENHPYANQSRPLGKESPTSSHIIQEELDPSCSQSNATAGDTTAKTEASHTTTAISSHAMNLPNEHHLSQVTTQSLTTPSSSKPTVSKVVTVDPPKKMSLRQEVALLKHQTNLRERQLKHEKEARQLKRKHIEETKNVKEAKTIANEAVWEPYPAPMPQAQQQHEHQQQHRNSMFLQQSYHLQQQQQQQFYSYHPRSDLYGHVYGQQQQQSYGGFGQAAYGPMPPFGGGHVYNYPYQPFYDPQQYMQPPHQYGEHMYHLPIYDPQSYGAVPFANPMGHYGYQQPQPMNHPTASSYESHHNAVRKVSHKVAKTVAATQSFAKDTLEFDKVYTPTKPTKDAARETQHPETVAIDPSKSETTLEPTPKTQENLKAGPMPEEDRQKLQDAIIQVCLDPTRELPTDVAALVKQQSARLGYAPCPDNWPKLSRNTSPFTRLFDLRCGRSNGDMCRCGSRSHRSLSHPECPLFAEARARDDDVATILKTTTKPETSGLVQQAMVDRWKRQKEESAETAFENRMERIEITELGRASKAPMSLSTMVLVAVAVCGDDDYEEDDDVPLSALGRLSRSLCTKVTQFIVKRWGHCYREPSHAEYAWRWKTDNPREPGTRTFDGAPSESLMVFAVQSGIIDELCLLVQSKVLTLDGTELTNDWCFHVERSILDDNFLAAKDETYGIPESISGPLLLQWQRDETGWYMGRVLVHKDVWKDSEINEYQRSCDDAAGINKFL